MIGRFFSPRSGWSAFMVLACWGLLIYLVGSLIGVLFAAFVMVVLLGSVKAVFRRRGKAHYLTWTIIESVYTITYATTLSLILLTITGFLIPDGAYLNIYALQLLLALPSLFVFSWLVHFLHHRYTEQDSSWASSTVVACIKTVILCVLLIAGTAFATTHAAETIDAQQEALFTDIDTLAPPASLGKYQVGKDILGVWEQDYATLTKPRDPCVLCSPGDLIKHTLSATEAFVSVQYTAQLRRAITDNQEVLDATPPRMKAQQIQELQSLLASQEDLFMPVDQAITPETSPKELWERFGKNATLPQTADVAAAYFLADAPLHQSMQRAVQHTIIYQNILAAADAAVTREIIKRPPVIKKLYKNRAIPESPDSKLIRLTILTMHAEQLS